MGSGEEGEDVVVAGSEGSRSQRSGLNSSRSLSMFERG